MKQSKKKANPRAQRPDAEKCFLIGITGGIGAGKSTVLSEIQALFPVYLIEADEVGRELMEPGKSVFSALVRHYGSSILQEDGRIDRAKLSAIGMKDEESQKILNAVEHPIIKDEILKRIADIAGASQESGKKPVILLEAALLVEGGLDTVCDEVWFVSASKETRIRRLIESRGYSRQKALRIISRQLSYREFLSRTDRVIHNGSDLSKTRAEISRRMKEIYASLCDSEV